MHLLLMLYLLQEVLKEPAFRKSPELWSEYIAWQKHKMLGGVRGLINVLDIRHAYNEAIKVFST